MKRFVNIFLLSFIIGSSVVSVAHAQEDYIVHTIKKGEKLSVLAKKYGLTPEVIAKINGFGTDHILHVGDKVKLPSNAVYRDLPDSVLNPPKPVAAAPAVTTPAAPVQAKAPGYVIHIVQKGEVYSVLAKKYNVSVDRILSMNDFKGNHVLHVGDKIKLPANAAEQTAETTAVPTPVSETVPQQETPKPATDKVAPAIVTTHTVGKKETLYAISKKYKVTVAQIKAWNNLKDNNISEGQQLSIGAAVPTETNIQAQKADATPVVTSSPATKVTIQDKPAETAPAVTSAKPAVEANVPVSGYFSSSFGKDVAGRSLKTANGPAMTFKTNSGWTDKKYYVLMNDVSPGSIVQVTNDEGKAIYAKVLWNMGDMKDNEGLSFRISDAAAAALNLKSSKFNLTVTYYE